MTVHELLHGYPAPLSGSEYIHWVVYFKMKAEEMEREAKKR